MTYKELPESGELVVCTVNKVMDFGAFVGLDEYDDQEGLIHISEVASGWVKYIRDHVREGQKIVCKVLDVNPDRGHIDLSLKDVNDHQKRAKIQNWKLDSKAKKWLSRLTEKLKMNPDEIEEMESTLLERFHSFYAVFDELVDKGENAVDGLELKKKLVTELVKTATDNIKPPQVTITGYVDLTCGKPDGIDVIKKALKETLKVEDGVQIEVTYVGTPRYRMKVTTMEYKEAESALRKAADRAIKVIQKNNGTGNFIRQLEKG